MAALQGPGLSEGVLSTGVTLWVLWVSEAVALSLAEQGWPGTPLSSKAPGFGEGEDAAPAAFSGRLGVRVWALLGCQQAVA